MKIIGTMGNDRFLVEATGDDLARVMGFANTYGLKDGDKLGVGKEIKVSLLYQALQVSRARKDEIAELANKLRAAAARVDSINSNLAAPIVEVEVKA